MDEAKKKRLKEAGWTMGNASEFLGLNKEIERKFLVKDNSWMNSPNSNTFYCKQGYIYHPKGIVRVRIIGDKGYLTLKGKTTGISRDEFEYEIPKEDAEFVLNTIFAESIIEKTRHVIEYEGFTWEVDVFRGDNKGLVVAEVELESEDIMPPLPDWVGEEVSTDSKYYNSNLVKNPYNTWGVANGT
jgi:CYTH domain-containing protein